MEKDKDKNIILYMLVVNDKLGPASAHLDTSCLAYNIRKNYQGRDKKNYQGRDKKKISELSCICWW